LSSVRPSSTIDFGYLEMIEDVKIITDTIKQQFPNQRIYALGHSLGGQIEALTQAKYPNLFDGLILVAANSVYYKGWTGKQRYVNLLGYYVFNLMSQVLGYFPGHKIGFGGKAAKTQMIDWSHVGKKGVYKLVGDPLDYETALKALKMPVLAIYIEGDWMSPKASMEHLYRKFNKGTPITGFTLTNAFTGVKLNHFNWVKNSAGIVKVIKDWLIAYPIQ
ncbi:MAG: alpha/beta fold hydrolase, partial [Saprospiraceae bacterium]